MSTLINFLPTNLLNLFLGYKSSLVLAVLGVELSSIMRFLFLYCNSSWKKYVLSGSLTLKKISFEGSENNILLINK